MKDLGAEYKILELIPGASWEEVNQAYKDLAFIWHPDRIPVNNLRLRQKAADKLKQINRARDLLRQELETPAKAAQPKTKTPPKEPVRSPRYQNDHCYYPPRYAYANSQQRGDLSGANFRGCDLKEKDLSGRNLSQADLSNADLSDCFLHKVNLSGANLQGANLFRANLLQANLSNANLKNVNLVGADLSGADLRGANLSGATLGYGKRIMVKMTGAWLTGAVMPDGTLHD